MIFGTIVIILTGFYAGCTGPVMGEHQAWFKDPIYLVELTCTLKGKPYGGLKGWFKNSELKALPEVKRR